MKFVSLKPKPLLVLSYVPLYVFYWRLNMDINYHQQASPSLTFASPLAKLNSTNLDQELLECFHASEVHMCSNKNCPPD
jgi:hypothetical protein